MAKRPRCDKCGDPLTALYCQRNRAGKHTWERRPWGECENCAQVKNTAGQADVNANATEGAATNDGSVGEAPKQDAANAGNPDDNGEQRAG